MKQLTVLLAIFLFFGCTEEDRLTEQQAIDKVEGFFRLLDVDVYDSEMIQKEITQDFRIFEMGEDFRWDQFDRILAPFMQSTVSTDWKLSDFRVSLDANSAHLSYYNEGVFVASNGEETRSKWLESVYLVREDQQLKLAFLQSDLIDRQVIPAR